MRPDQGQVFPLFFLLSCLIACVLGVGPLGITWNRDMATKERIQKMVWMSVIEFDNTLDETSMPNEVLAGLAKRAYGEMKTDHASKPWSDTGISNTKARDVPTTMIALVRDKRIYFASSMRSLTDNKKGFAYDNLLSPHPVRQALIQCEVSGGEHKMGGNCGEQMAAVIAFGDITDGSEDLRGSRIIAWIEGKSGGKSIDPCGGVPDENGWVGPDVGCKTFVQALKMTPVPAGTEPRDLDANAHFVTRTPCVRLPSSP